MRFSFLLLCLATLAGVGVAYAAAPLLPMNAQAPTTAPFAPQMPPIGVPDPDYRLGPTDKIRVTVFGQDDLSGEYQIDGTGYVRLPLVGQIQAAGDTAQALEARIAGMLANGYLIDPKVAVEVTTYRPFYIIGAVNRPGEYPYVSNMSALNAVALAGGFTTEAVQSAVYVRHEGSTVEQELAADQVTKIRPGDVVRVKTTVFWQAMDILSPFTGIATVAAARLP